VKDRRVRFTATAGQHLDLERTWWLENRDHQELFATELESAVKILALLPGAGTPYLRTGLLGLRRLYLRKIACHIYYTFNDDEVIVRALWGARRERGPMIEE
jgi:plasmid stabilization system protein ParE